MRNWAVSQLRALLAGGLLAGVYLVGALVVAFDLAILGLPVGGYLVLRELLPAGPVSALIVAAVSYLFLGTALWVALAAIAAGRRAVSRIGEPWMSVSLPTAGTEPLRALIADVCAAAGTAVPRHLSVTAAANAAVTEPAGWRGRDRGGRVLYLGLPLLAGMSADELRAVLSHEIGHYAGGHARASALVHRGAVALDAIRDAFQMLLVTPPRGRSLRFKPLMTLAWWLLSLYAVIGYQAFTAYAAVYWRLSFALRRGQEYHADQIAESVVGAAELGAALRRVQAVAAAWHDFQARYIVPMRRAGCMPDATFDVFGRMIADGAYLEVMEACERELNSQATAPTDTHPCLADRLARLDDSARRDGARPGGSAAVSGSADGSPSGMTLVPVLTEGPWRHAAQTHTMRSPGYPVTLRSWEECLRLIGQAPRPRSTAATLVVQPLEASPYGEGPWPAIADVWLAVGTMARVASYIGCAVLGLVMGAADYKYQHPQLPPPSFSSPCGRQEISRDYVCNRVIVRPGDTLRSLACQYDDSVAQLQALNGLGDSTKVRAGEKLYTETNLYSTTIFSSACGPLPAIPTWLPTIRIPLPTFQLPTKLLIPIPPVSTHRK